MPHGANERTKGPGDKAPTLGMAAVVDDLVLVLHRLAGPLHGLHPDAQPQLLPTDLCREHLRLGGGGTAHAPRVIRDVD